MRKEFLPYEVVRTNAITLAHRIWTEGFVPDVIYVSLRGGAYLGNVISEYFKIVRSGGRPVYYAAVVARSYRDIGQRDKVTVDGWTYDPAYLRHGDKVLLVDDIFDSGRTINHLVAVIMEKGAAIQRLEIGMPAGSGSQMQEYQWGEEIQQFRKMKTSLVERFEKEYFSRLLALFRGNMSRAARHAGMDIKNLHEKMARYGLKKEDFKQE